MQIKTNINPRGHENCLPLVQPITEFEINFHQYYKPLQIFNWSFEIHHDDQSKIHSELCEKKKVSFNHHSRPIESTTSTVVAASPQKEKSRFFPNQSARALASPQQQLGAERLFN